ncbi:ABC transporter substrate-binding protein [Halomicrococcus sp. NG-SE-24]|uniref:ABC transporter substrate-binding protein n=1 Tax=Halomicrococcus sp. NG-SE-24 TaxID=3436928 RepID=UPI003D95DB33
MTDDTPTLTRRRALQGIGSVAGMASLAGCGSVVGKSEQLRYAQVLPPQTLDPVVIDDPWSAQVANLVFQGLYAYDRGMNLVPVLANGEPTVSDDGKRYAVTLKKGATFQNGQAVRAEDVKYSLDPSTYRGTTPSPNLWQVEPIRSVSVADERTVEFELKHPYPAFEHTLTRAVVPKASRNGNEEAFGTEKPVGSGPYEVDVFKPGSTALLTSWDGYWQNVDPGIRDVKFVSNHAGLARSMSLKTGQNDVVERIQPKLWSATKKFPGSRVTKTRSYHSTFVGFNTSDGPTSKKKVREAIDYLLPMSDLVEHLVGETGERQYSPLPRHVSEKWGFPLEKWKDVPHERNRERARTLMEEADVGSWSPLVAVPEDLMREKFAEAIVHELKKLGFRKARTKKYSWSGFRETILSGNSSKYAMFVGSWAGAEDPDSFLYPLFHRNMEGVTNATFYRNPDLMENLERSRQVDDRRKRKRLYEETVTTLLEERVHLPVANLYNSFGVKDRVEGFEPHPLSQYNPQLLTPDGRSVSLRE